MGGLDVAYRLAVDSGGRLMQIEFKQAGPLLVATLQGRLDATEQNALRESVTREIETTGSKGVIFDLAGLEYVSSAGFREFFLIGRELQRLGGGLAVCSLQPAVQRLFDIAQFQTAYPVCATLDEALVALGSSIP
jgi:anti-anti-sigma factor